MNSLGDIIISQHEHECVLCHRAVNVGDPVMAAAYDALTWPRNPLALVWLHVECGKFHTDTAHRAQLYTTGWFVLSRPQACARCGIPIISSQRAWRVVDISQQVYLYVCISCHSSREETGQRKLRSVT